MKLIEFFLTVKGYSFKKPNGSNIEIFKYELFWAGYCPIKLIEGNYKNVIPYKRIKYREL